MEGGHYCPPSHLVPTVTWQVQTIALGLRPPRRHFFEYGLKNDDTSQHYKKNKTQSVLFHVQPQSDGTRQGQGYVPDDVFVYSNLVSTVAVGA